MKQVQGCWRGEGDDTDTYIEKKGMMVMKMWQWSLWLLVLMWLCHVHLGSVNSSSIPSYTFDPFLLHLSQEHIKACLPSFTVNSSTLLSELQLLYSRSYHHYTHAHELLAYHYFIESSAVNPHYRKSLLDAEFEYIPILPLHWRIEQGNLLCSYQTFIKLLLQMHVYLTTRDNKLKSLHKHNNILPKRFFVASTFNMRTMWGSGMPTPYRRGTAYENMTSLVTSLYVGHYERWPECPDLLRKWWIYNVELPYLIPPKSIDSIQSYAMSYHNANRNSQSDHINSAPNTQKVTHKKEITKLIEDTSILSDKEFIFYFSGHFELPGPELVCSTRNSLLHLHTRNDLLIHNISRYDAYSPFEPRLHTDFIKKSIFCLVLPGESYSSSFFYSSLFNGCIPVVINDWYVFSFPWFIDYSSFTLRILEEDFWRDGNKVLNEIKTRFLSRNGRELLIHMIQTMNAVKDIISYQTIEYASADYRKIMAKNKYFSDGLVHETNVNNMRQTVLAWELMLLEMRYSAAPKKYYSNIPCERPLWCSDSSKKTTFLPEKFIKTSVTYDVKPLNIELSKSQDTRSYLCQNKQRLIGYYKIVFYQQCVRVLWPLSPGKFKPKDNVERFTKNSNISAGYGISRKDYEYVLAFHNINGNRYGVLSSFVPKNTYPLPAELWQNRVRSMKNLDLDSSG